MTYAFTSSDARTLSTADLVIYNEIDYISRKIAEASQAGNMEVTVANGTTMTTSTPVITVTGTQVNPTFTANNTLIFGTNTVTLGDGGNDGTNLAQAIADINDANVTGLVASKNSSNQLVLSFTPLATDWSFVVGAGTANSEMGLTANTYTPADPTSVAYYNLWSGQTTDRKKTFEYSKVVNHFQNLGYKIITKQNTDTNNTFKWEVYW